MKEKKTNQNHKRRNVSVMALAQANTGILKSGYHWFSAQLSTH